MTYFFVEALCSLWPLSAAAMAWDAFVGKDSSAFG